MSGGACAAGLFFGFGLILLLSILDRRLNREENIVQTAATITVAYLCYYTAAVVWSTSGVLATVVCGITYRAFGDALINDNQLICDLWGLVEHLLNTVLFALGGLVWGSVIANAEEREGEFTGRDWGYLIILYILLIIIRFALFIGAYPLISRIGLKSSKPEMIFQAFGGLRGAVGISLAIVLDNTVREAAEEGDFKYVGQTNKVFGFVGGIAFMTLCINATVAGPLLRRLGLADTTAIRKKIIESYKLHLRYETIEELIRLLAQPRFAKINFALIRDHVDWLKDLRQDEVLKAYKDYRNTHNHEKNYRDPNLSKVSPYLEDNEKDLEKQMAEHQKENIGISSDKNSTKVRIAKVTSSMSLIELRTVFLEILRSAYARQVELGELYNRQFLAFSLEQSIDFALDSVSNGSELNDWEYVSVVKAPWSTSVYTSKGMKYFRKCFGAFVLQDVKYEMMRLNVERCLAFLHAHDTAQRLLSQQFLDEQFSEEESKVIAESRRQCVEAVKLLKSYHMRDVEMIVSHNLCTVLLYNSSRCVEKLHRKGLLKGTEAETILEKIQESLQRVYACRERDHPGELPVDSDLMSEKDVDEMAPASG
jgi:NhaP-type Na+/H+ or K+/H+ antiporter